jgi:beta-galactosidase
VVSFGRLPMTTFLRDDVLALDGEWSFAHLARPEDVPSSWTAIDVPGCWTMQGWGRPQYTNVQMPFAGPPPRVPDDNPTGVYRRVVDVPASWAGQRVVLHVAGAESVVYVDVDGTPIGMSTDSRLPSEYDLTDHVEPGRSFELTLTVVQWSAATYLEDQDHWYHAGLHRSVFLYATPVVHIDDVHAVADYDPATGDGNLLVRVTTGAAAGGRGWSVRIEVEGLDPLVADAHWEHPTSYVVNSYLFTGRGATVSATITGVEPWSAETPNLRTVRVVLVDSGGADRDEVSLRVGFRRVEVRGHELLVNGVPVLIKGVNRHDHDDRRGKAVTRASIRHDIELMKANNLNAVRTSHYPSDAYLYDVCDELGMYVVDEANVESHAYLRSLTKDPAWAPAILERITRMAQRDKNHPSIIMWSLGNESGSSPVHDAAAAWLRAWDGTRPIHYEGGLTDDEASGIRRVDAWRRPRRDSDVVAPMYPSVDDLIEWATTAPPDRPLIMCEYIHAMNNSCGGFDDYWAAIESHAGLQGGFVWDWVDQALVQTLPDGRERWAYGGDFGDHPNDGPFCLNGLVFADRTPHPSLFEARAVLQPVGIDGTRVTNKHGFRSLSHLQPSWSVTVDGNPIAGGDLEPLGLAPGESADLPIELPTLALDPGQIAHLTIRFHDGAREVAAGQTELARSRAVQGPQRASNSPRFRDLGPRLCLWRAPIDNEVFGQGAPAARWEQQGLRTAHERVELRTEIDGDRVTHTVDVEHDDIPRVGVRLTLPPEVVAVDWLGRGPHESYCDRNVSALVGRWHTMIDDWGVPYVHPQANGNRTGVRWLRFLDEHGDVVLTLDELDDLDVTVSRHTDGELADATHLDELPTRDHAFVWIDARHRGVGSGAVGPDTAARHRIAPGPYTWSYRIA